MSWHPLVTVPAISSLRLFRLVMLIGKQGPLLVGKFSMASGLFGRLVL